MSGLDGKVALVTGAGSGIGRASALAFAQAGACVVISDVDIDGGEQTVHQIGRQARFVPTDVTDEQHVDRLVQAAVELFGRLDYAHNNAGIGAPPSALHEAQRSDWDLVLAVGIALPLDGGTTAR